MKKTKYTVDYFINKFLAIPDSKWVTGEFKVKGQCCALGHCGERSGIITAQSLQLTSLFFRKLGVNVTVINDGVVVTNLFDITRNYDCTELGDTPKERVLNALTLIKAGVSVNE